MCGFIATVLVPRVIKFYLCCCCMRYLPKDETISNPAVCKVSLKSIPKLAGKKQFGDNFCMPAKSCTDIPGDKF